ncbi:beta-propeller uncharacterized protein DUF5122 [Terracoccus luteus]|uniref:Beta-propeller uncharacterized protein DUF5122 n=1 Tax=Terracoccus luteus TaxID=53356 RepID=A0A495XWV7_9MICO|nr:delta-60 repeat domain-containing protein [Terracoccus luteus]RKT78452.1 beta-propeller uncharacterized protein DUF5122 [Terracoccus luteus]
MRTRRGVTAATATALVAVAAVGAGQVAGAGTSEGAALAVGPSSLSTVAAPTWWGANGRVTDIKAVGSRVYLAGAFDYIGPQTGYGVAVDPASGAMRAGAPRVDGIVRASAPDGAGGWYIAGDFTRVGTTYRRGAAQVTSAGTLTAWDPKPKGSVNAIAVTGDRVVLAGDLSAVGTANTPVSRVTAVDRVKGARLTSWTAAPNGTVRSVVATPTAVYIAGDFTAVGSQTATRLARLSPTTGAPDPAFLATANGPVRALSTSPDGSTLYAGGTFSWAGGAQRANLAAFAAGTGAVSAWAPAANATVSALAVDPSGSVAAGGQFTTVAGVARTALAQVTPSAAVTAFDARLSGCNAPHTTKNTYTMAPCVTEVTALATRADTGGTQLLVGGRFGRSGTLERHNAAAFSLGTAAPTAWNPVASGLVLSIATTTTGTFLGGDLTSVGGLVRTGLAALDATTGVGDPAFRADTDNIALDLEPAPDGSRLYVAGSFLTVAGQPRTNLAALTLPAGTLDPTFVANANNTAIVVKAAGSSVYVGGAFNRVGKTVRNHLVKLDGRTGAIDAGFVVNTTGPDGPLQRGGMVQGLAVRRDGSRVYLAGPFTAANGVAVTNGILVVDGRTGARTPGQLGGVASRCSWVAGQWVTNLYLNPAETSLYGGDTCPDNIYKWDAVSLGTSSNPTGLQWLTWCNAGFQAGLEVNGRFYYAAHGGDRDKGGFCWQSPTQRTNVDRQRLVEFDAGTGALTTNTYTFNSPMGVWALEAVPSGLLVGGDFSLVGGSSEVRQGLALLPGTP